MTTDFEKIKVAIRFILDAYPYDFDQPIQSHPLFTSFATLDVETREMVKITPDNFERLKQQWYRLLDEELDKKNLWGMMVHIHKPYRLPVIFHIEPLLSKEDFTEMMIENWIDTEFPHQNGVKQMVGAFKRCLKEKLMNEDDKKVYDELPDVIECYRGLQANDSPVKGLSWTLNMKKAEWFARRWKRQGKIYKARIHKKFIFAYNNNRGEEEVILNPYGLNKVECIGIANEHRNND